jgi:hypothetical protein
MMLLTQEQIDEYFEGYCEQCPRCKSHSITEHQLDRPDRYSAYQEMTCDDCGLYWNDAMHIVSIQTVDQKHGPSDFIEPTKRMAINYDNCKIKLLGNTTLIGRANEPRDNTEESGQVSEGD